MSGSTRGGVGAAPSRVDGVDPGNRRELPRGGDVPNSTNVDYVTDQNVPNAVRAKVGTSGTACIYTCAETHLLSDVSGFLPTS